MDHLSPIRPSHLREQVVEQIRRTIIEGRLRPGDHIPEKMLTTQLNVSRTPIREALILLESEGLTYSIPHRGSFVRSFSVADVEAIFSMRTALENFAAQLTVKTMRDADYAELDHLIAEQARYIEAGDFQKVRSTDMQFHEYLVTLPDHPILLNNWRALVAQIAALLHLRAEAIPTYDEELATRDHQSIVAAYRSRELERVSAENERINQRVAGECRYALEHLEEKAASGS